MTSSTPEVSSFVYPDLAQEITELKEFAKPLHEEIKVTPIMSVVARIMSLPEELTGLDAKAAHIIEMEVAECRRQLDQISYEYVCQIVTDPKQSKVFSILSNGNKFVSLMKRHQGEVYELPDGTKMPLTPKVIEALSKYRFSIGTPPITPKGIKVIEEMVLGDNLKSLYEFRDMLGGNRVVFDRFIENASRLIEQSTHYTTTDEKKQYEKEATEFVGLEGLRGIPKTVISGSADTAIRLMKGRLFSQHRNGNSPVKVVETPDQLDENLIEQMTKDKRSIYVVKVTKVPYSVFTSNEVKEEWKGVIGRLVLVDDSENARKSSCSCVYSIQPRITQNLAKFHVKDSGTPANTQLNFRRIIENFGNNALGELKGSIEKRMAGLEAERVMDAKPDDARVAEWVVTAQSDYLSLKKFKEFIDFIIQVKNSSPDDLEKIQESLSKEVSQGTMDYFFKALKGENYHSVSVPQGGGRRGLGHIAEYQLAKTKAQKYGHKISQTLSEARSKLEAMKIDQGLSPYSSAAEQAALSRAMKGSQSPNHALRQDRSGTGKVREQIGESTMELIHKAVSGGEDIADAIINRLDKILGVNLPGIMKGVISKVLKNQGIESAAKMLERGMFRSAANKLRSLEGYVKRMSAIPEAGRSIAEAVRRRIEPKNLDFVEKILNDLETGTFRPKLALPEMGWTFNDVFDPDEYPPSEYIRIPMGENGVVDPVALQDQLRGVREALSDFPKIFDIYCSNILLIINDPHNPTAKVLPNETKLKLLDVASEFGLTIVADEAYRAQVVKEVKDKQGYPSLQEFYEQNRSRFPRKITIHAVQPTTKWAMRAGGRTGVLVSNDPGMISHVHQNTDAFNLMSLYMDKETLNLGLLVKSVCKALEPATRAASSDKTIDKILERQFSTTEAKAKGSPIYFELLKARNDIDFLRIRNADTLDYRKYINDLISKLKGLRLEKQTQRDTAERTKAAVKAIENLEESIPGISEKYITPEGPFYMCVQLDETGEDPALQPFLERIALARKIDVVPNVGGYVRFAFGGEVDGSKEGYDLLTLAIQTDLSLLFTYWQKFKEEERSLNKAEDLNPIDNALKSIFPGGEADLVATLQEKKDLTEAYIDHYLKTYFPELLKKHQPKSLAEKAQIIQGIKDSKKKEVAPISHIYPEGIADYLSKIEPSSPATIVTIRDVKCKRVEDFLGSPAFHDLFNHYLLQIKKTVPALANLSDEEVEAEYGAHRFVDKWHTRMDKDIVKEVFEEIVIKIANQWFNEDTIKILALEFENDDIDAQTQADAIGGASERIGEFIKQFVKAFVPKDRMSEITFKPTFQAGYQSLKNKIRAHDGLPKWARKVIKNTEFAGQTIPTDPNPEMITSGVARVAGHDRMIAKRDGDGKDAPKSEYFSNRLSEFAETMDPKEYVCKMVQIGPVRTMLVMHRSYSHYIAEELRLMPQFDVSMDDMANLNPDAVSFLGIPSKTMGEDYKVGYYFDKAPDGSSLPVSWVDRENVTDYMGYLKKPLLTVANEKVKEKGGLPVHGSAIIVKAKNGLRKTAVLAGDSGTGKSETIIAMVEQIIEGLGGADQIEDVEMLAGDMLSMWEGADGQLYMMGTESGDFMRMSDIGENWQSRMRDKIETASTTNKDHPTNPRTTIGGLCDEETFLRPVRVNIFSVINNCDVPKGASIQEIESPMNMMMDEYPRGYRSEKGTSGDQPNLYASILKSKSPRQESLLKKYGETFDELLGWEVLVNKDGKAINGILKFNDIDGEVEKANNMIQMMFDGQTVNYGENECQIKTGACDPFTGQYLIDLYDGKEKIAEGVPLDRNLFNQIYRPITSTYCGNPFIDPRGMDEILKRFGTAMTRLKKQGDFITTVSYTQLAVRGAQFSGPAKSSQDTFDFVQEDPSINDRFQKHKARVEEALTTKYGVAILGQASIPAQIEKNNLHLLETQESSAVLLTGVGGRPIVLNTPKFTNPVADAEEILEKILEEKDLNPSLITPDEEKAIQSICASPKNNRFNLEGFDPDISEYDEIQCADSIEELIYQILIVNGKMTLQYPARKLFLNQKEVKKAEIIAQKMMGENTTYNKS